MSAHQGPAGGTLYVFAVSTKGIPILIQGMQVNTGPYADSNTKSQEKFDENIEIALIPTMVGLATEVQAGFSGEGEVCSVSTNGGVQTGDKGVECESFVESWTETESISSVTEAGTL